MDLQSTYGQYIIGYDLLNALFAMVVVYIIFVVYKTPSKFFFPILAHLVLVFFLNDFLFPIEYMPDQFRYIDAAASIRNNLDFVNYRQYGYSTNVLNASLVFSLFPAPFLNSVFSIAIINFILYSFLFSFLYKKRILTETGAYFYLLFPSFALYSAVGLRDTLVLFITIISVYQLYTGRLWMSITTSILLLFIKAQNFIIFLLSLIVYKAYEFYGWKGLVFIILLLAGIGVVFNIPVVELLNYYRSAMFRGDGGDMINFIPLSDSIYVIYQAITGFINIVFAPFIWEVKGNFLLFVQSIENTFIGAIVFYLMYKLKSHKDKFANFLIFYFVISMTVYSLIVFNIGSISRYKYTFILIFVIFAIKLISNNKRYRLRKYEKN